MARPRAFRDDAVRAALLRQFWACGYAGTSLPDLEAATGVSRKSLYNAYGDKHAMFAQALTAFTQGPVRENLAPLQAPESPLAGIEAVLLGLVALAGTEAGRSGCMVCNTAREAVADDPAIGPQIDAYFAGVERAMRTAIVAGQARGEINDRPADDLARLCLGAVVSISVLARARQPQAVLRAIAEQTVAALR